MYNDYYDLTVALIKIAERWDELKKHIKCYNTDANYF